MIKNKVFVGPGNIAGNAFYVAKSLSLVEIDAKSFSYYAHPFGYSCDHDNILVNNPFTEHEKRNLFQKMVVNKYSLRCFWAFQKFFFFMYTLIWYDTFIFISYETFFKNNKDLRLLKFFKKKIAFLFIGCLERDPNDIINQTDKGFCSFCKDYGKQKFLNCYKGVRKKIKVEYTSKFADIIFSHRDTTSFVLDKSKVRRFFCISDIKIREEDIYAKFETLNEITISHFPSNNILKGTNWVTHAIFNLKEKGYKFRYIIERVQHSEIEELLKKTHILIDQFSVGHGLLGVEGMASGCVVICRTAKWFREDFPELPLVSCEPEELTDVLIDLISDREKMLEIALKSYKYYKKYHTPEVVGEYYKKTLGLS